VSVPPAPAGPNSQGGQYQSRGAAVREPPARAGLEPRWGLAIVGLVGLIVAAGLAGYAQVHPGNGTKLFTLGFTAMLPMKAWLTSAATALVIVQVISSLAMWGRLPGVSKTPGWVAGLHRWSGTVAFVLTLPVVFHCVWSLGFSTASPRALVHSVVGCVFYGIFAAKMLALRMKGLPGWTLPVLGGLLAAALTTLWFTASLWFFTTPGQPLY
jgi:hypothetical protein